MASQLTLSQPHKVGNNGININLISHTYIFNFLYHLDLKMLVKVKSDVKRDYIKRLQTLLVFLILNLTERTKLAILAFLYCGEIVKNCNVLPHQSDLSTQTAFCLCEYLDHALLFGWVASNALMQNLVDLTDPMEGDCVNIWDRPMVAMHKEMITFK